MTLKLDDLAEMLHAEQQNIFSPATNLLPIHHQLRQLETFRNETLLQAKSAKSQSLKVLNRRFERLDKVIAEFSAYIGALSRNVLPIVRAGYPEVIVKLCKIAELEGLEDQKVFFNFLYSPVYAKASLKSALKLLNRQLPSNC